MATRSLIALQKDNSIESIYCHWDGNPEHVGAMLLEHYNSNELAQALIDAGDMSSIAPTVDACNRNINGPAITDASLVYVISSATNCDAEFIYVRMYGYWTVIDMSTKVGYVLEDLLKVKEVASH